MTLAFKSFVCYDCWYELCGSLYHVMIWEFRCFWFTNRVWVINLYAQVLLVERVSAYKHLILNISTFSLLSNLYAIKDRDTFCTSHDFFLLVFSLSLQLRSGELFIALSSLNISPLLFLPTLNVNFSVRIFVVVYWVTF